jgi:ribose 5-phosphate isomerase
MTQDELKQQAALRALDYVIEGKIVGVGTGSTGQFLHRRAGHDEGPHRRRRRLIRSSAPPPCHGIRLRT